MKTLDIDTDFCTCGSQRVIRDCCLFAQINTKPPGPETGYSHPKCYARALRDCAEKISLEHYISEGLFTLFGGTSVELSGLAWQPDGEQKTIPIKAVGAKVLCTRHNNALAQLDKLAVRFFKFFRGNAIGDRFLFINGAELERWMLKMLCGFTASGSTSVQGNQLKGWTPSVQWLKILFGSTLIDSSCGLHFSVGKYSVRQADADVTTYSKDGRPSAVYFLFCGVSCLFSMETLPSPLPQPFHYRLGNHNLYFRPKGFEIQEQKGARAVFFSTQGDYFVITRTPRH